MDRREFLTRFAAMSAGTAAFFFARPAMILGAEKTGPYDMVAVLGGSPEGMFERGIGELGGIGRYVKRGQTVMIKPNASWGTEPERGATTTPALVGRVIEHCLEAGAKRVYVVDHTIDSPNRAYDNNEIGRAAKEGGGRIVPANSRSYYQEVQIPGARKLKTVHAHEQVMEADVIINIPILKHHGSTRITSALKNLMGLVWDRWYYHAHDLHRCIAEFPLLRTPTLNIVDAHTVMMSGGPRGSSYRAELKVKRMQIISSDIVAADAAAAKTWGTNLDAVRYISIAQELGLGNGNLDALNIRRIRV
jgi:uncharacterized protein (DUF362 family)